MFKRVFLTSAFAMVTAFMTGCTDDSIVSSTNTKERSDLKVEQRALIGNGAPESLAWKFGAKTGETFKLWESWGDSDFEKASLDGWSSSHHATHHRLGGIQFMDSDYQDPNYAYFGTYSISKMLSNTESELSKNAKYLVIKKANYIDDYATLELDYNDGRSVSTELNGSSLTSGDTIITRIDIQSLSSGNRSGIKNIYIKENESLGLQPDYSVCVIHSFGHYYGVSMIDETPYNYLTCRKSGKVLDNGGHYDNGTTVHQWKMWTDLDNQHWALNAIGGGYYQIISKKSGKALDNGGHYDNGTTVHQWKVWPDNHNQHWKLNATDDGYFQIISRKSGKALDNGGTLENGDKVHQWKVWPDNHNQHWKIDGAN